jgi:hypothetical protein
MKNDPHVLELREKRSFLCDFLEPLENGHMLSGETAANKARAQFLRREIAELDVIIAREEARSG